MAATGPRHPRRTVTLTVPSVRPRLSAAWRKSLRAARTFEAACERHWPMTAYALLTFAAAGYVIHELTRI